MELTSRVGRFEVSGLFFRRLAPDEGTNLFHRMVVLDVRTHLDCGVREYLCIHPDFRPRAEGERVPLYHAVFDSKSAFPAWVEIRDGR